MKKVLSIVLLMLMLVISASTAMALDRYSLQAQNGDEVPLRVGIQYYPEITMTPGSEPITEWTWTSSDEDVAIVWPDGSIMAAGGGKATLTGESKDGSGQTVKIKVYVPKVYTTDDSMTISSPDGLKFGYFMNTSGINQISTTGTCFTTEPLEDSNGIDMCKILPVKAGTGSIVFTNNGRKLKTVKITVKKSAFDPVSTPATDSLVLSALDGEAYAVVKKSVNIRSEANSDSKIVGHADKGDKLIVTKPFYSSKWHQINYDGKVCYVSAKYCDIEVVNTSESPTPTIEPSKTKASDKTPYTGRRDSAFYSRQKYILDYLENKGYRVQAIDGGPNIGKYEDDNPDDMTEEWYAFVLCDDEWIEYVITLFAGGVSSVTPRQ